MDEPLPVLCSSWQIHLQLELIFALGSGVLLTCPERRRAKENHGSRQEGP